MTRYAIILLNYGSANLVIESLKRLVKFKKQPYIIVVNNDYRDTECLKKKVAEFNNIDMHFINSDVNCGYARGNNIGLRYALEKLNVHFCVVANPDVDIDEYVLEKFYNFISLNPSYLAVSGQMMTDEGEYLMSHWALPNPISDFKNTSSFLRLMKKPAFYDGVSKNVDILQGALVMYNLKNFNSIGLFDHRTFLYGEERIVGWKANKATLPMYYMSDVKFKHKVGASINLAHSSTLLKYLMVHRSRKVYYKHFVGKRSHLFFYNIVHYFLFTEKVFVSVLKGFRCKPN